ncbi:MAG: hypothetical protein M3O09_17380 [Acidobacteriota bacterium]|nr:hypothetical protein [Acidobacteriota bacterium]
MAGTTSTALDLGVAIDRTNGYVSGGTNFVPLDAQPPSAEPNVIRKDGNCTSRGGKDFW